MMQHHQNTLNLVLDLLILAVSTVTWSVSSEGPTRGSEPESAPTASFSPEVDQIVQRRNQTAVKWHMTIIVTF